MDRARVRREVARRGMHPLRRTLCCSGELQVELVFHEASLDRVDTAVPQCRQDHATLAALDPRGGS